MTDSNFKTLLDLNNTVDKICIYRFSMTFPNLSSACMECTIVVTKIHKSYQSAASNSIHTKNVYKHSSSEQQNYTIKLQIPATIPLKASYTSSIYI